MSKSLFATLFGLFDVVSGTIQKALLDYVCGNFGEYSATGVVADISAETSRALISHLGTVYKRTLEEKNTLVDERNELVEQNYALVEEKNRAVEETNRLANAYRKKDNLLAMAMEDKESAMQEKETEKAMQDERMTKAVQEKDQLIAQVTQEMNKAVAQVTQENNKALQEKYQFVSKARQQKDQAVTEVMQENESALQEMKASLAGAIVHSSVLKKDPDMSVSLERDGVHIKLLKQEHYPNNKGFLFDKAVVLHNSVTRGRVFWRVKTKTPTLFSRFGVTLKDCPLVNAHNDPSTFVWNARHGRLFTAGKCVGTLSTLTDSSKAAVVCLDMTATPYQLWVKIGEDGSWERGHSDIPAGDYHFLVALCHKDSEVILTETKLEDPTFGGG
eukprot:Platyproteum_vivax@DN6858_c0_g1_i2.p1